MKFTNEGLVKHMETALEEKWGYVYGTFGQVLTDNLFAQKLSQYPVQNGRYEAFIRSHWIGKRVADCVGAIKSYLWWNDGKVKYTPVSDLSANGAYHLASKKGDLKTMDEVTGLCVWRQGHVGVYVGGGYVIESKGTMYGFVKTPLQGAGSNNWLSWFEYPGIEYIEPVKEPAWMSNIRAVADRPQDWIEAVQEVSRCAESRVPVIVPQLFKFLPELILKLGSKK